MKRWWWLGLLLVLGCWRGTAEAAPTSATLYSTTYTVQPYDTLFRIALNHGLTTQELAQANYIVNPSLIYVGQVLVIPSPGETPPPVASTPTPVESVPVTSYHYVVKPGDTLYKIAVSQGVTMSMLAQANGISNYNVVYVGQTLIIPSSQPSVAGQDRWVDVNLSTQTLTAYEGNTAVFTTLISSGMWQFPTVTGQFHIWLRYSSQTMNGYSLGYDYYLPDVPYVMYFYQNYALHGTYWHDNFGTPMSHGCVNMRTSEAEWLYNWSTIGTLVNVHY